jgi:hypothetical protein
MTHIPVSSENPGHVEVTPEHRVTSAEVLDQLSREVSSPKKAERALYVRIGHYDQPGFLNPLLFGFWIMPLLLSDEAPLSVPGLEQLGMAWAEDELREWVPPEELRRLISEPGVKVHSPNESTEERPSLWACVLNTSIESQIESTLISLAMLIERQELVVNTRQTSVAVLPDEAARVDGETIKLIGDEVRSNGWVSATRAIRARAEAAGCSIHVEYRNPLMELHEARARMPLTRHVYNTLPGAKEFIDRIVNSLTQGWAIAGPVPEQLLQRTRDMLDGAGIPSLIAHCVRDAFVCGVGVLYIGSVPLRDPWLLRPEEVEEFDGNSATQVIDGKKEVIRPVVAMQGASQLDSSVALSLLEPLVLNAANRDLFLQILLNTRIVKKVGSSLPPQVRQWAETTEPLAIGQLTAFAKSDHVFHPATLKLPPLSKELYSAGFELMEPAVSRLSVGQ